MSEFLLDNPGWAVWIIGLLLTIISSLAGCVLWYVANILRKTEALSGEIKRNNEKISKLREYLNNNISQILTSQKDYGDELIKIQRTLVSATVVLERRKTETDKILENSRRSRDKLEEMGRTIDEQQKILYTHQSEIIKLKGGNILVRGKKS